MIRSALEVGEVEITDAPTELLFRQVTPNVWISEDGVPAKDAFGPKNVDKGKPSYSRESKVSAQDSFEWHNNHANSPSVGTWACSVDEVNRATLSVIDDSDVPIDPPKAPGHCYVDFRGLTKREERNLRSILLRFALARGIVHPNSPILA